MGFDAAQKIILQATAGTTQAAEIAAWVVLLSGSYEGQVLAASLAIDLVNKAISGEDLAGVVALTKAVPSHEIIVEFNRVLNTLASTGTGVCASRLDVSPLSTDKYVRTIELSSFVTYYLGPTYGYTTSPGHLEEVRSLFELLGEWPMGEITRLFRGARGICWVAPQSELAPILAGPSSGCTIAAALNDALGLGILLNGSTGIPELVVVRYPANFEDVMSVTSKQPTALDATWKPDAVYYISCSKESGWGKSHSCSGQREGIRERVHATVMHLTDDFVASLVGESTPPIVSDRKKWRDAAFARLDEALATS